MLTFHHRFDCFHFSKSLTKCLVFEAPSPDLSTSIAPSLLRPEEKIRLYEKIDRAPLRKFDKSWWEAVAKYAKEWLSALGISCELFIGGFIHLQAEIEEKPQNFYIHGFPHLRWSFWIILEVSMLDFEVKTAKD